MGMTLWIHTLEGRALSKDTEDHTLMNRHSAALDDVCRGAGVRILDNFLDVTDLEFNMEDFDEDEEEDAEDAGDDASGAGAEPDPETGFGYGIDDMAWFDAAEGLVSLKVMRAHVAASGLDGLQPGEDADLLEELDHCIATLEGPATRGARFHLAVIA